MNINLLWFLPGIIVLISLIIAAYKLGKEEDNWGLFISLIVIVAAICAIIGAVKLIY